MNYVVSLMCWLPVVGMLALLCVPSRRPSAIKAVALVTVALTFLVSLNAYWQFSQLPAEAQYIDYQPGRAADATGEVAPFGFAPPLYEHHDWIPQLGIAYVVGVDGLSLPLILLTTGLMLLVVIFSWNAVSDRIKWYYAFFLLLETAMLGVFCSLDLFMFYVFFEIGLVPMYFLIGIWGGPRRQYAAIKFFLYTLFGSLAMLLALLALHWYAGQAGMTTFNIVELAALQPLARAGAPALAGTLIFWGFFLGFAIKVPMWPFHTWLPDAHVEAPTAGSVILAGVLLKLGTYGFVRILMPILPQQCEQFAAVIVALAVIAIIYGAFVALAQANLKKLVAYSSVNHMGYVMLGLGAAMLVGRAVPDNPALERVAAAAMNGAILQMLCHGIITAALFFLVGIIYDRTHTLVIAEYGGIMKVVPKYAGILMMMSFASLGLPGLAGFVAEFHVFIGSIGSGLQATLAGLPDGPLLLTLSCIAIIGVLLTAAYFLWMMQRLLLGPVRESLVEKAGGSIADLNLPEILTLGPLMLLTLAIGVIPSIVVLEVVNDFSTHLLATLRY